METRTNLTKEEKSFKEVVSENKWKIVAGVSVVVSVASVGIGLMAAKDNKTMYSILSEGVLQDAIITTNNKINSRKHKLRVLEDLIAQNPKDITLIKKADKIRGELTVLVRRLGVYNSKLNLYEVKDIID